MAKRFIWACVGLLAFAVAACAPASSGPSVDTAVAATLQAQVAPTDTQQPIDGEIQAQSVYGDCANTGQVQLAYLKEGNLWLWVQGEAPRQLTHEADAVDVRISDD